MDSLLKEVQRMVRSGKWVGSVYLIPYLEAVKKWGKRKPFEEIGWSIIVPVTVPGMWNTGLRLILLPKDRIPEAVQTTLLGAHGTSATENVEVIGNFYLKCPSERYAPKLRQAFLDTFGPTQ
jgi:hypothetical protein